MSQPNESRPATPRTVGVEEELLLVDPRSGAPVAAIEGLIGEVEQDWVKRVEREVKQEQVELVTPPLTRMVDLAEVIRAGREEADRAARRVGAQAVALATSVVGGGTHLTDRPRFHAMASQYGITMREQLTCGLHVHVDIASDEEAAAVLDRIRPWLPLVHAMSTNSPFWGGQDSGYASYRYQLWGRWPSAGPYEVFGSAAAYRERVDAMVATGAISDRGMIYFDARMSHHQPTIEVRVADICLSVEHTVAIVAIIRALVETASREWREGIEPADVSSAVLRLAMWAASRHGLNAQLVDLHEGGRAEPVHLLRGLLQHLGEALREAGDFERVEAAVADMLRNGTGADRQRRVMAMQHDLRAVVADAIEATHTG